MIGLRTMTGMSAVSRATKSASDVADGSSIISTGVGKRVSHREDNERESKDCVGVGPEWMECAILRGREWRRVVFSGLEGNSSSSRAVTRSNAPESECTPCTVPDQE